MFLGVVLHASIAYKANPVFGWPRDFSYNNVVFDYLYHFIHLFRMELFFAIAGFFTHFLILKIGPGEFAAHRFKRIVIPFVLSTIVLVPLSMVPFRYFDYMSQHGTESLHLGVVLSLTIDSYKQWNGLLHLWFLYDLIYFYTFTLIIYRFRNIGYIKFLWLKISAFVGSNLVNHKLIVVLGILLFINTLYFSSIDVPVNTGIRINLALLIYYYTFFAFGIILHFLVDDLWRLKRHGLLNVSIGLLLSIVSYAFYIGLNLESHFIKFINAFATVFLLLVFWGFFRLFLTKRTN